MARVMVCVAILASALLPGHVLLAQTPAGPKPVAVVNGEAVTRAEFDARWEAFKKHRLPGAVPDDRKKAIQMQMLSGMMDEVLFKQFLKKSAPPADQAVVNQRFADFEKALKGRKRTLKEYCAEMNVTEAQLRQDLALGVQWNAYVDRSVKEAELERFYAENQALFDGLVVRASQIFIGAPRDADAKTHKEALQKIQALRQELQAGQDFAAVAKKHSQDASAANGGDLGYFPPTRVDHDPFMRTVVALKPGQTSDIVQTDYGYHLIKLVDRKDGSPTTYAKERENVRMLLGDDMRGKIILEQRKAAKIEVNLP